MNTNVDNNRAEFTDEVKEAALQLIHSPEKKIEYRLCARLGIASVAALAHEMSEHFSEFAKHDSFKQWVGREVAKEMSPEYEVVQPRGRVSWANFFTYGAVWGPVAKG